MREKFSHISKEERRIIEINLDNGKSIRKIAEFLGRDHSAIAREIKRNTVNNEYKYKKAQHKAYVRRYHAKFQITKIKKDKEIEEYVVSRLNAGHSPDQIAGRMKVEYRLGYIDYYVRKDAIYNFLYSVWGEQYCIYLKSQRKRRKRRSEKKTERVLIKNKVSIHKRDPKVKEMKEFGHFEADTLGKPKNSVSVGVGITEMKTKYFMFTKVKRLKHSMKGFNFLINKEGKNIFKTITFDNGIENQKYETLKIDSYFCDPYSSWQKPIIEGTFGLLRKYIPKKAKLEDYSFSKINDIVYKMNNTPRKCLGYYTPQEMFDMEIAKLKNKKTTP